MKKNSNILAALLATIKEEYGDIGCWEIHASLMSGMPEGKPFIQIVKDLKELDKQDEE